MAARGRGRGRGVNMSFNMEQLGFAQGEALPGPVLQPPPIYPKMERKPVPLHMDPELEYLLTLKRDFVDFVRDSPSYLRPTALKTDIDRYSDRYQSAQPELDLHWTQMPVELRPQATKRKAKLPTKIIVPTKKVKSTQDLARRLEELEQGEKDTDEDDEEEEEEGKEKKEGEEDEEEMEKDEVDEEMDAGTDYVNNYFDNGDGFLDEDDDMDDGPTY